VATISRLLEIVGLFCRILSLLQGSFANETYNFMEPTNRSHLIHGLRRHLWCVTRYKHVTNVDTRMCVPSQRTEQSVDVHMYLYVYVCIYIYRYLYIYVQIHIRSNIHIPYVYIIYAYTYTHTYINMYICMYIYIGTHVRLHILTFMSIE